jgi:hypothetical protein
MDIKIKEKLCNCDKFIRKIQPFLYRGVECAWIDVCGNCGWFAPTIGEKPPKKSKKENGVHNG